MNIEELGRQLVRNKVPHHYYSLLRPGGGDCFVLQVYQGKWVFYYLSERGSRHDLVEFDLEDEACCFMFNKIKEQIQFDSNRTISLQEF